MLHLRCTCALPVLRLQNPVALAGITLEVRPYVDRDVLLFTTGHLRQEGLAGLRSTVSAAPGAAGRARRRRVACRCCSRLMDGPALRRLSLAFGLAPDCRLVGSVSTRPCFPPAQDQDSAVCVHMLPPYCTC